MKSVYITARIGGFNVESDLDYVQLPCTFSRSMHTLQLYEVILSVICFAA
jgi:hypothetical protein